MMNNHELYRKTFRGLYIVLFYGVIHKTSANSNLKCNVVVSDNFKNCLNKTVYKELQQDLKHYYQRSKMYKRYCKLKRGKSRKCRNYARKDICSRTFKATVIDIMPFSFEMMRIVNKMFRRCCGPCARLCPSKTIEHMSKVNSSAIISSDIVFPILAGSSVESIYGYHFVPIMDAPISYYVTARQSKSKISQNIINSCKHLWPLLTICLLFALISGFFAWTMEMQVNPEEFPKPFHVGLFEGFWWSFVSMTTVGYGDKAPKSRAGKIFSVFWILAGITICSMFTASLTNEIGKTSEPVNHQISGEIVGGLKHRLLDAAIIAEQGGIIQEIESDNITAGIKELIKMLHQGNITGFLVDSQTYYYFYTIMENENNVDEQFQPSTMIRTEKMYGGEKLSFGALMKNKNHFEYFKNYFSDNKLQLKSCYHFRLNTKMSLSAHGGFILDPDHHLFYKFLYFSFCILGGICIFGVIYEIKRRRSSTKTTNISSG